MELGSEQLTENSIRKLNGNNNSSNPAIFPYVILNAGISVDGKIAARDGSSNISSGHDLKIVQKLRSEVDADNGRNQHRITGQPFTHKQNWCGEETAENHY
jgi:hypothetical protein